MRMWHGNASHTCLHVHEHLQVQLCFTWRKEVAVRCLPQLLSLFAEEGSFTEPRVPQFV